MSEAPRKRRSEKGRWAGWGENGSKKRFNFQNGFLLFPRKPCERGVFKRQEEFMATLKKCRKGRKISCAGLRVQSRRDNGGFLFLFPYLPPPTLLFFFQFSFFFSCSSSFPLQVLPYRKCPKCKQYTRIFFFADEAKYFQTFYTAERKPMLTVICRIHKFFNSHIEVFTYFILIFSGACLNLFKCPNLDLFVF